MNKVERPWGWYQNLYDDTEYKVKKLFVEKDQKISLQYHNFRSEHWVIVEGSGKVQTDSMISNVSVGDYIFIPRLEKHRIYGGEYGIMIVEVQLGSRCVEEDIVRLEDEYGRD
jgi:mannose-6-phosphate isomerase-like protein (cupin superfamily)